MKRLPLWLTLATQAQVLVYLAIVFALDARGDAPIDGGWLRLTEAGLVLMFIGGGLQVVLLPWLWWRRQRMGLGVLPAVTLSLIGAVYAGAVGVLLIAAVGLAGA